MAVFNRNLQTSKGLYGLFSGALAVSFREGNQLVWGVDQPWQADTDDSLFRWVEALLQVRLTRWKTHHETYRETARFFFGKGNEFKKLYTYILNLYWICLGCYWILDLYGFNGYLLKAMMWESCERGSCRSHLSLSWFLFVPSGQRFPSICSKAFKPASCLSVAHCWFQMNRQ